MQGYHNQFRFRIGNGPDNIINVAWGAYDAAICMEVNPWDITGCAAIIQEAGGIVTNFKGEPWSIKDMDAVLAAPYTYKKLLAAVQGIK